MKKPNVLDRLCRWPQYEPNKAEIFPQIDRWLTEVLKRKNRGDPRRVLFIHGQLPGETGSGVYLQQIAAESMRQGIDIYVLSAGYSRLDASDITGLSDDRIFTCLFTPPGKAPRVGAVKTPISGMSVVMPYPVLAYRDRTEEEMIDFLAVFGNKIAELVARLQPDIIHVNHLWFLNGLARLMAPWIPLVASAHGTARKLIVDTPRLREFVEPCVSSVDHVCAISPQSVLECTEMFKIQPEIISIEGYGYEPELFYFKDENRTKIIKNMFNYDSGHISHLIVSVAKFVDWKGLKELTMAVGHLRERGYNIMGLIVGEGDRESRLDLEAFIARRGLTEIVHLPGKVNRAVLPDIYRAADVYVLPSHVEPYGLVLMEALACGTPAVAGNAGGPPSYIPRELIDKGFASLVEPINLTVEGDALPEARAIYALNLADGIENIFKNRIDQNDRALIAAAMKSLTWSRLVKSLAKIYNKLLEEKLSQLRAL